jgi:hypothetical protein
MSLPLGQNIKSVAIFGSDAVAGFSVLSDGSIPNIDSEFRDNVQGLLKREIGIPFRHFVEFQV